MKKAVLGTLALLVLAAAPALAGSATSDFTVSATVLTNCTISTVGIVFGNYDPTSSTPLDGTGSVVVTCTAGTSGKILMSQGANPATGSTDAAPLRQTAGSVLTSERLRYDLYQNSGRSTSWGNTTATGEAFTASTILPVTVTIYGRIPINQGAQANVYNDTVTATVTF
ncbi:MAG TPA: spore coat U domain-containing protein [Thermoanaerobaculia bacterium]|jgi:spore coat protein U-like protein